MIFHKLKLSGLRDGRIKSMAIIFAILASVGIVSLFIDLPFNTPIWINALQILILLEFFYWIDSEKIKRGANVLKFTAFKKIESLLDAFAALGILNLIRIALGKLDWGKIKIFVVKVGAVLNIAAIVIVGVLISIAIIYLYLKLNSFKYSKK